MPNTSGKIIFVGNCQAEALAGAMAKVYPGQASSLQINQVASPTTYLSHPDSIPKELIQAFADPTAQLSLEDRRLENQFEIVSTQEPPPRAVVFTLFDETAPLYEHLTEKYVFFVSHAIHQRTPELTPWINGNFRVIVPDPDTYYERFTQMLTILRRRYPTTPFLLLKRLTPRLAYAPKPYSYLANWNQLRLGWHAWIAKHPDLAVLEMDRVVGGVLQERDLTPCQIFPFLRPPEHPYRFRKYRRRFPRILAHTAVSRDIEHAPSLLWEQLARHIVSWLDSGTVAYSANERPPSPAILIKQYGRLGSIDFETLKSGEPSKWSNAFESMLLHPRLLDWKHLEKYVAHFPLDRLLLRTMRTLLDLYPSREAAQFLESHYRFAEQAEREPYWKMRYLSFVKNAIQDQQNAKKKWHF